MAREGRAWCSGRAYCLQPEGTGLETQPLHICAGKAWRLKQPFPRPRAVREAYNTGYALLYS